jgi:hypothetical protein
MTEKRIFDLLDRFTAHPDTIGNYKLGCKEAGKWKEYTTE